MRSDQEPVIRLTVFISVLVLMSLSETFFPRRKATQSRLRRAGRNLALVVANTFVLRLLPLLSAVGVAYWAQMHRVGLLNQFNEPLWLNIALSLVLFDVLIYGQHVASHRIPLLWRFHRVHHADRDLDATSGLRFHTLEIVFSMAVKCVAALILGPVPEAIVLFEVILNGCAVFNHSNTRLPGRWDNILRKLVVTPDMHRVHHSVRWSESNSNFGFSVSWWDRLFSTYQDQPQESHETILLGLPDVHDHQHADTLFGMLTMPFTPIDQGIIEANDADSTSATRAGRS